jgi:hypothetical protein
MVTRLPVGLPGKGLQDVQTASGALPTSYPMGAGVNRPGLVADRSPPYRAGLINLLCGGKLGAKFSLHADCRMNKI